MSEWLIGIVGIISLGLLLEILIPEGQTSKYVKGAFSLLVIFVVISPIPKLLGGEYDFNFEGVSYEVDKDYLVYATNEYTSTLEGDLETILKNEGILSDVKIVTKKGSVRDVDIVEIKIYLSGIDENDRNTYITRVKEIATKSLGVSSEKVTVSAEYGSG